MFSLQGYDKSWILGITDQEYGCQEEAFLGGTVKLCT